MFRYLAFSAKSPIEEVVEEILSGRITDGKTQAAVLKAYMLLKKERGNGEK